MRRFLVLLLLMISVPCYGETVCMSWEDKTSDAYWEVVDPYGSWNGVSWDSVEDDGPRWIVNIRTVDYVGTPTFLTGWTVGYEPLKVRVTLSGVSSLTRFYISTINGAGIIVESKDTTLASGQELVLTFDYSLGSIYDMVFESTANSFQITKIEFLVVDNFGSHRKLRDRRGWLKRGVGHDYPNR